MGDSNVRILHIAYDNVALFKDGKFDVNFIALDRVAEEEPVFKIHKTIYGQKTIALSGINASGKTSALKLMLLAMSIVVDNYNLNAEQLYGRELWRDGSELTVIFCYKGFVYKLHSIVGIDVNAKDRYYYKDEFLYKKSLSSVSSKKNLFEFSEPIETRSKMDADKQAFIKSDASIVVSITKNNDTMLRHMLPFTNANYALTSGSTPQEILHLFDTDLDELNIIKNETVSYQVKFKGSNIQQNVNGLFALGNIISSGTIKGQNIMSFILQVVRNGGYLVVDELENHLNKELVHTIINLFKNPKINKRGACLIFSTHYAEILDFIDRKDNIFIMRKGYKGSAGVELKRYADVVTRNDIKKSDIILSDYIGGTAPSYEYIQALEDFLCRD